MPLSRNKIKHFRSLHQAKGRQEAGQFLVEGLLLVQEALKEGWPLEEVLLTREFGEEKKGQALLKMIELARVRCNYCSPAEMSRIAEAVTPQGIVALAKLPDAIVERGRRPSPEILLLCECVSDPGNLGTLLRTADWFGVEQVLLGAGSADPFSPKVVRASAGAIFRVRTTASDNLAAAITREQKAGRCLYAAIMKGKLLPEDLPRSGQRGLVVGHEKRGVSDKIADLCTSTVRIPPHGRSESLNLAVAAGILLYSLSSRT